MYGGDLFVTQWGITYDGNGNTGGSAPAAAYSLAGYNTTTATNSGSLTKTGWYFTGWNSQANGLGTHYNVNSSLLKTAADITLYAEWTQYHLTYSGNGATSGSVPVDSNTYIPGDEATVLDNTGNLAKTGQLGQISYSFTFTGWNTLADGTGTHYEPSDSYTMGAADVTLYADWRCLVTYDGNGYTSGTVPTDATEYLSGSSYTAAYPGTMARTHYDFTVWNTLANGTGLNRFAGTSYAITANLTLYAKWVQWSVTYNGNGATAGSVPVDSNGYGTGDTVTVLGDTGPLYRTGRVFSHWNRSPNGSGISYDAGDTFLIAGANVTLYAQWVSYTVTYDGNGHTEGSPPTDITEYGLDEAVVIGNIGAMKQNNRLFPCWNTAADGSGRRYAPGDTLHVTGSITLYAEWDYGQWPVIFPKAPVRDTFSHEVRHDTNRAPMDTGYGKSRPRYTRPVELYTMEYMLTGEQRLLIDQFFTDMTDQEFGWIDPTTGITRPAHFYSRPKHRIQDATWWRSTVELEIR